MAMAKQDCVSASAFIASILAEEASGGNAVNESDVRLKLIDPVLKNELGRR